MKPLLFFQTSYRGWPACGRLGRQTFARTKTSDRLKITFVDMTYPKGWTGSLLLCPLICSCRLSCWLIAGFEVITICISGYMDISQPAYFFITCYAVLTKPNRVETAVHGCNCWLSVWTLSCRCPVKLFT